MKKNIVVIKCSNEKIHSQKEPNKTTFGAMKDAKKGKTFKAKDLEDLCKQLGL
jgi:hypothetical protein